MACLGTVVDDPLPAGLASARIDPHPAFDWVPWFDFHPLFYPHVSLKKIEKEIEI
jgi:hypothetical protein